MIERKKLFESNYLSSDGPDIFRGAMDADIEEVKLALEQSPEILNARHEKGGVTPLAMAAWYGNYEIVDYLCSFPDIDLLALDDQGRTVWYGAVALGREDIVQRIMQPNAEKVQAKIEQEDRFEGSSNVTAFHPKGP